MFLRWGVCRLGRVSWIRVSFRVLTWVMGLISFLPNIRFCCEVDWSKPSNRFWRVFGTCFSLYRGGTWINTRLISKVLVLVESRCQSDYSYSSDTAILSRPQHRRVGHWSDRRSNPVLRCLRFFIIRAELSQSQSQGEAT